MRGIPGSKGVVLGNVARERMWTQIETLGEMELVRILDISRLAMARCLAGLPVQKATAKTVSRKLAEMETAQEGVSAA